MFLYVNSQMEQTVEEKLRQKYTLIDKSDSAAIAAAQQVIWPSRVESSTSIML